MEGNKGRRLEQPGDSLLQQARRQSSTRKAQTTDSSSAHTSRLVFGLNSKTNKLKHDEYAEKRFTQQQQASLGPSETKRAAIALDVLDEPEKQLIGTRSGSSSDSASKSATLGKVRASKYGNFYKPQDLVQPMKSESEKAKVRAEGQDMKVSALTEGARKTTKSSVAKQESSENINSHQPSTPKGQQQQRMQFHVPLPPQQVNLATTGKGSVVSYAKSRIYDKPSRTASPVGSSVLDSGAIPESILSGFKPPKQVNVSKARESWEGGEPFAKCKSRQRLAAQANKKLLHDGWSMSSVVATQQLQLQQALASASSPLKTTLDRSDQPVKVLTRGSVLERVQQFEKSPSQTSSNLIADQSALILESPSTADINAKAAGLDIRQQATTARDTSEASLVIGALDKQTGNTVIVKQQQPTSKQAIYKTRVSSLQLDTSAQTDPLASIISSPTSPKSPLVYASSSRLASFRRRTSSSSNSSTSSAIPRFYHPNGKPNTYEIELQKRNIVACFDRFPERKALLSGPQGKRHFHSIAQACGFSEYFKEPLCLYVKHQLTKSNLLHSPGQTSRKQSGAGPAPSLTKSQQTNGIAPSPNINSSLPADSKPRALARAASIDTSTMEKIQSQNHVTCEQFLTCWRNIISNCFDNASRFIHLLTLGKRKHLLQDDFIPLIQSIIDDHPGLKFLRAAPDFHLRYIQTVIARIFFCINRSWTGKISLSELRASNLLAVLQVLSQEEDINQITDYFSYEHFYVIYCKFWSLDQDHDLLISKEDLARHNDAAISSRIIDRIFQGIVSRQVQKTNKMSYSDFVWFLIAEEDKKHPRSVEYWFRLMDLDGDGYISMYEMDHFYSEQKKRLELMNIEALPFNDCACQILDLVNPKVSNKISLSDLKRTKLATIFFDTFINLEKYLEHESREFASTRDTVQDGVVISDWDRYAQEEYESLVIEESTI